MIEVGPVVVGHKAPKDPSKRRSIKGQQESHDEGEQELQQSRKRRHPEADCVAELAQQILAQVRADRGCGPGQVDLEAEHLDRTLETVDSVLSLSRESGRLPLQ